MRKDTLAAGAKSAKFAGGVGEGAGPSVMSDEDRAALEAETAKIVVEKKQQPKKIFRPLGTTLLVRRADPEKMSDILLTETLEKEKPAEGTVLEVGPKVVDVKRGDSIVFGKYAGTEFKLNGEVLLIMEESEVKGTLDEETPLQKLQAMAGTVIPDCDEDIKELNVGGCIVGRA
jgi:chaperonin GroES